MCSKSLSFELLDESEILRYMEFVNSWDSSSEMRFERAAAKVECTPRNVATGFFTGGASLTRNAALSAYYLWQSRKQSSREDEFLSFIESLLRKYNCEAADKNQFPNWPTYLLHSHWRMDKILARTPPHAD